MFAVSRSADPAMASHTMPRRGITLLEVLISIAILSIGLLSAMALIPAGRTYIKQAELDDRTATIVPTALATLETFGLFNEDSLEWVRISKPPYIDPEVPAERPTFNFTDQDRWPEAVEENATPQGEPEKYPSGKKQRQVLEGMAEIDLSVAPKDRRNETTGAATALEVPIFRDEVRTFGTLKKLRMIREALIPVRGQLWRFREGTQRGPFRVEKEFADDEANTLTATIIRYPDWVYSGSRWQDPAADPLGSSAWTTQTLPPPEDKDFYLFQVEAGQMLTFDWSHMSSGGSASLDPDVLGIPPRIFPVEHKRDSAAWQRLLPFDSSSNSVSYVVPTDGQIRTGVALKNDVFNTIRYNPSKENFPYEFDLLITQNDRMIAIDPLMCTHLDRVIAASSWAATPTQHPLAIRRRRFADFQQQFSGNTADVRPFIIPRANWETVAAIPNVDAAVGIAERMCRVEDTVALDEAAQPDAAPEPIFSVIRPGPPAPPVVLRRQVAGRMTWMLTAQPEDPGSVESNWHAGKNFDVSIVIFQDRIMPAVGAIELDGEYAYQATWDDGDGLLRISVKPGFDDVQPLDDEDIRRVLAPGSWVLLAPRFTVATVDPNNNFRLEWLKLRSVQYDKRSSSETLVTALLEKEPDEKVLLRDDQKANNLRDANGRYAVTALCYQGVVGVIRRSIPIGSASP